MVAAEVCNNLLEIDRQVHGLLVDRQMVVAGHRASKQLVEKNGTSNPALPAGHPFQRLYLEAETVSAFAGLGGFGRDVSGFVGYGLNRSFPE